MIQSIFKTATCTKLQETNYKMISQWYRTPEILQKRFPNTLSECWRCQREQETLLHVFWSCPRVEKFWKEVREIIQKFSEVEILKDPALFLLHLSEIPRKTYRNSILCNLVNAAKAGGKWLTLDIFPSVLPLNILDVVSSGRVHLPATASFRRPHFVVPDASRRVLSASQSSSSSWI